MEQERMVFEDEDYKVVVPQFMKEIVAEISRLARRSPDINQRSGVSVRASIANYESMLANAQRRAISVGENEVVPRVSDLPFVIPAIAGKVEFETVEDGKEEQILDKLIQGAVLAVFNRYFSVSDFDDVVTRFKSGISVEVGDMMPSSNYERIVKQVEGLQAQIAKVEAKPSPPQTASVVEFILEGLHLNKRLNKDRVGPRVQYRG
jgi:magnesium chelatase subunit I